MRALAVLVLSLVGVSTAVASPALAAITTETLLTFDAPTTSAAGILPTADGRYLLATDTYNNLLLRYDLRTHVWLTAIPVSPQPIGVDVTSDGKTAVIGGMNGIDIVNLATRHVTSIPHLTGYEGVAITPDNKFAYVANYANDCVSIVSLQSKSFVSDVSTGASSSPEYLTVSPDGSKVYVADVAADQVSVISTATRSVTGSIVVSGQPYSIAISPNGSHLYVGSIANDTVSIIATSNLSVEVTVPGNAHTDGVTVSPDGSQFAVTSLWSDDVLVYSTSTNALLQTVTLTTASSQPNVPVYAPNGAYLYTATGGSASVTQLTIDPPLAPPTPTPTTTVQPLPDTGQNFTPAIVAAAILVVGGAVLWALAAVARRRKARD